MRSLHSSQRELSVCVRSTMLRCLSPVLEANPREVRLKSDVLGDRSFFRVEFKAPVPVFVCIECTQLAQLKRSRVRWAGLAVVAIAMLALIVALSAAHSSLKRRLTVSFMLFSFLHAHLAYWISPDKSLAPGLGGRALMVPSIVTNSMLRSLDSALEVLSVLCCVL